MYVHLIENKSYRDVRAPIKDSL